MVDTITETKEAALQLVRLEASYFLQPKNGEQTGPSGSAYQEMLQAALRPASISDADRKAIIAVSRSIRLFRRGDFSNLVSDMHKAFGIRIVQNGDGPNIVDGGLGIFHPETASEAMAGFRAHYQPYLIEHGY